MGGWLRAAFVVSCVGLALGCATAGEQPTQWQTNGQPAGSSTWHQSDGEFAAMLIITDEAEVVHKAWNSGSDRAMHQLDSVEPGVAIETIVFFGGCSADPAGNCLVEALYTLTTGSGEKVVEDAPMLLSKSRRPPGNTIGISELGAGFETRIEDRSYLFAMKVFDRVGKRAVTLTKEIVVEP